jgi:hypothetical protein
MRFWQVALTMMETIGIGLLGIDLVSVDIRFDHENSMNVYVSAGS